MCQGRQVMGKIEIPELYLTLDYTIWDAQGNISPTQACYQYVKKKLLQMYKKYKYKRTPPTHTHTHTHMQWRESIQPMRHSTQCEHH